MLVHNNAVYSLVLTLNYFHTFISGQFINCEQEKNRYDVFVQLNAWFECEILENGVVNPNHMTKCIIKDETDENGFSYLKPETILDIINKRKELSHLAEMRKEQMCNEFVKTHNFESIVKMVEPKDILEGSFRQYINGTNSAFQPKVLRLIEDNERSYVLRNYTSGLSRLILEESPFGSHQDIADYAQSMDDIAKTNRLRRAADLSLVTEPMNFLMDIKEKFCALNETAIYINKNAWVVCRNDEEPRLERCIINARGDRFEYLETGSLLRLVAIGPYSFRHLQSETRLEACNSLESIDSYYDKIVLFLKRRRIKESAFSTESSNAQGSIWKWDGQKHTKL